MLRNDGYEVVAASDGKRAAELTAIERPDLVLLDVMMPEMDGIDACRRLKSDPRLRNIPVILVTAKTADDDVIRGLDVGADDYVTKPFRKEILAARVRSALRVKRDHDTILRINDQLRAEIAGRKRMESELARASGWRPLASLPREWPTRSTPRISTSATTSASCSRHSRNFKGRLPRSGRSSKRPRRRRPATGWPAGSKRSCSKPARTSSPWKSPKPPGRPSKASKAWRGPSAR